MRDGCTCPLCTEENTTKLLKLLTRLSDRLAAGEKRFSDDVKTGKVE